jgi:hypothetical protein
MAEYEAAVIRERARPDSPPPRSRGRKGGRKPKMTPELINKAQRMYNAQQVTWSKSPRPAQ